MRIKASDIFDVRDGNTTFPFDLKFVPKGSVERVFEEPLVYVLWYKNTPLYVGYTFSDKTADVRQSRWTKQLETILCRGYRVGFNNKALEEFVAAKAFSGQNKTEAKKRHKKTNVMTSAKRVKLANDHWSEISKLSPTNQHLLSEFSFEILIDPSINTLKDYQSKTKKSIQSLNPLCNG